MTDEDTEQAPGTTSTGGSSERKKDVWVIASTALDGPTKAKLDELGEVKYIIGPDAMHSRFLGTEVALVLLLQRLTL